MDIRQRLTQLKRWWPLVAIVVALVALIAYLQRLGTDIRKAPAAAAADGRQAQAAAAPGRP